MILIKLAGLEHESIFTAIASDIVVIQTVYGVVVRQDAQEGKWSRILLQNCKYLPLSKHGSNPKPNCLVLPKVRTATGQRCSCGSVLGKHAIWIWKFSSGTGASTSPHSSNHRRI